MRSRSADLWCHTRSGPVLILLVITLSAMTATPRPARAADPLLTVTKDTVLGAVTGLILSGTLTLVIDDSEKKSETVRWGVVLGTFGGFVFGVYHATRGDEPLFTEIEPRSDSWASKLRLPPPSARASCGTDEASPGDRWQGFPSERELPASSGTGDGWSLRFSLLKMRW